MGWIRRGYLDALEGTPYDSAPGPERFAVDTAPETLPERWRMYLAGLYLGQREVGGAAAPGEAAERAA